MVLLGQNDRPSDASLLDVYRASLENVPSMALYLELFEQKLRTDPTRNYQILHDTVEARLGERDRKKAREEESANRKASLTGATKRSGAAGHQAAEDGGDDAKTKEASSTRDRKIGLLSKQLKEREPRSRLTTSQRKDANHKRHTNRPWHSTRTKSSGSMPGAK